MSPVLVRFPTFQAILLSPEMTSPAFPMMLSPCLSILCFLFSSCLTSMWEMELLGVTTRVRSTADTSFLFCKTYHQWLYYCHQTTSTSLPSAQSYSMLLAGQGPLTSVNSFREIKYIHFVNTLLARYQH